VRIDATNPSVPAITGKFNDGGTFQAWAIAQRHGVLVVRPSLGTWVAAMDPVRFTSTWEITVGGTGHALATDGTYVYVPLESSTGQVVVLAAGSGQTIGTFTASEDWSNTGQGQTIYGTAVHPSLPLLAVAVSSTRKVYLFDVSTPSAPALKGTFALLGSGNLTMAGTRLWVNAPQGGIQCWNVANPREPGLLGVFNNAPYFDDGAGGNVVRDYGQLRVNAAGTRLYAVYQTSSVPGARGFDPGKDAGLEIFSVAGNTPVPLAAAGWQLPDGSYAVPTGLDLAPTGATAAVTYSSFGVRFHSVQGDAVTGLSTVPTSGESRDVYADSVGYVYSFANTVMIPYGPSGQQLPNPFFDSNNHDGQWIPFRDGLIITPSGFTGNRGIASWRMQNGTMQRTSFYWDNEASWSLAFNGTYLYQGGDTGVVIYQIGKAPVYDLTPIGTVNTGPLRAVALNGSVLWGTGPQVGVVAVDVSNPTAPRLIYRDGVSYVTNGDHVGLVVAKGRVYAGCGSGSVRIYDPTRYVVTGSIPGYFVTFLDTVAGDLLVLSHYGDGIQIFFNEGVYVYDLRGTPDVPTLFAHWPSANSGNFRARVINGKIYRCPLWGIEELAIQGYP